MVEFAMLDETRTQPDWGFWCRIVGEDEKLFVPKEFDASLYEYPITTSLVPRESRQIKPGLTIVCTMVQGDRRGVKLSSSNGVKEVWEGQSGEAVEMFTELFERINRRNLTKIR